jgi:hypothetical protein
LLTGLPDASDKVSVIPLLVPLLLVLPLLDAPPHAMMAVVHTNTAIVRATANNKAIGSAIIFITT